MLCSSINYSFEMRSDDEIMMKRKGEKSADFISDLPPPILHHILSYLSFEDSVRTSVLSKQWNSVKKSFPILEFKQSVHEWESSPRFKERLLKYLEYVDRSLQNFARDKLCIEKMNLCVTRLDRGSIPLVNTWVPLALHNGVSDLRFHVGFKGKGDTDCFYPLPETTFTVNSSLLCGSSEFFLLKKLELSMVCLTEKMVEDIVRNCPNLSDLRLMCIFGLEALNISKPKKLASLTITGTTLCEDFTSIFVDALSLQCFSLELEIQNWPCEIDLHSCCNLIEFELINSSISDAEFNMLISRFPLLEVLRVSYCFTIRRIRISPKRLKLLDLVSCDLEAIEIDAQELSEFLLIQSLEEEQLPVIVLAHAIPGSMKLSYNMDFVGDRIDSLWFFKIREYLIVPVKSMTLSLEHFTMLHDDINEVSFDLDELRDYVIPPLVEIDCLDLTHFGLTHSSDWEAFIDGLLWSCYPKKVKMIMSGNSSAEDNCVKTLCRMLSKNECKLCSNLSHCMCWRSRFKAAKIETIAKGTFYSDPTICRVTFGFDWEDSATK